MSTILAIEDSMTGRILIQNYLENLGHQVVLAKNGVEGVRKALLHHPDLITLDVGMPVMNGFQTARVLNQLELYYPLVFLSESDPPAAAQSRYPSMKGWVVKSRMEAELRQVVEKALGEKPFFADKDFLLEPNEMAGLLAVPPRRRVLVVDNDPALNARLAGLMRQTGLYDVFSAQDGQRGLIKVAALKPEVVLLGHLPPPLDSLSMGQLLYVLGYPISLIFIDEKVDETLTAKLMRLESVRGVLERKGIVEYPELFLLQVEKLMEVSPDEKQALAQVFQEISGEMLARLDEQGGFFQKMDEAGMA